MHDDRILVKNILILFLAENYRSRYEEKNTQLLTETRFSDRLLIVGGDCLVSQLISDILILLFAFGNLRAMRPSWHRINSVITESVICVWLADKPKDKKMKTANKSVKAVVTLVREPSAIDQMFKRNALGYLESSKADQISVEDSVCYVVHKLEAGQSAMREAILLCGWVFKTKTAEQAKAFEDSLKSRWNGSTLPNLVSIAKQLGKFESEGLDLTKVKDLYGVRDCAKVLKSEEHGKQAIAMLNEGKAPRAVQKELKPKEESKPVAPVAPVAVNITEQADNMEVILLSMAERYSKIGEHEARLKLTKQFIAKMNIGNYTFLPTEAAKAVETLKAKK
jgi:hypothetical protein